MLIVARAEETVCTADFTHCTTERAVCHASRQIWTTFWPICTSWPAWVLSEPTQVPICWIAASEAPPCQVFEMVWPPLCRLPATPFIDWPRAPKDEPCEEAPTTSPPIFSASSARMSKPVSIRTRSHTVS